MATIREVAKAAGVSIATVSRVLNHPETVADETMGHINKVIAELGFSPNGMARSLALNKTSTIALIIPTVVNPVYPEIAIGVEDVAHRRNYSLLLCNSEADALKEKEYLDAFLGRRVDGIIIAGGLLGKTDEEQVMAKGIALVHIGRRRDATNASSVYTDFELGGYMATRHLIEQGYRHLGLIAGPRNQPEHADKERGFERALWEADILFDPDMIALGDCEAEGGYLGAKKLLRAFPPPRAIFAANDLMAIGAMDAIKTAGFRIPEDVALIGFDNIQMASLVDPKLTTISYPAHRMGSIAARLLFDMMDTAAESFKREGIYIRPELKVRKSCGHSGRLQEIFN
jgi:LacI family transcriptional regulator